MTIVAAGHEIVKILAQSVVRMKCLVTALTLKAVFPAAFLQTPELAGVAAAALGHSHWGGGNTIERGPVLVGATGFSNHCSVQEHRQKQEDHQFDQAVSNETCDRFQWLTFCSGWDFSKEQPGHDLGGQAKTSYAK
jgi:hypothetical protein